MNKLGRLTINNDNFAFDTSTGSSFSINDTAKEVIELLSQDKSEEEIIQYLCSEYNISKEEAYLDIVDFLTKLSVFNLVGQS